MNAVDSTEQLKMMSKLYQYNSTFFRIVMDWLKKDETNLVNHGYRPFLKKMDKLKIKGHTQDNLDIDTLKLYYFQKMISESKGSKLVIVVSPMWYGHHSSKNDEIVKEICRDNNIVYLDFSNDPKYVHHDEFFKDGHHMNNVGADEFSKDLAHQLKKLGI